MSSQPVTRMRRQPERSTLFVGSVEKAFQVLEAFRDAHRVMSMAEIARAADLDRSATQRLVHTMEQLGYIRRVPESALYALTSKVLRLSYNYLRSREIIDRAAPYLLEMAHTLGETSNLQELDGHEIVFLARFPGRHLVNVDFAVGSRLPAVFTASGRAMLSKFELAKRKEIIRATPLVAVTPMTETDPKLLLDQIETAARQGYAIVQNQTVVGDISVAAAITDHQGLPIGAINVSVPATRWTIERAEEQLLPHVLLAATSISQAKGGTG
jgi:IclR family transcriptional regulator, pca regulon regulatory protein